MTTTAGQRLLAIAVASLLALSLLAAAVWLAVRAGDNPADALQIIPPQSDLSDTANTAGQTSTAPAAIAVPDAPPAPPSRIAVYVTGAVANPGVYALDAGQRLDDLLALAGGPTASAALERVNLAAYVVDAGHYRIPTIDDTAAAAGTVANTGTVADAGNTPASSNGCNTPLDINTATAACLETLPNIGPARAEAIVAHREQTGPFVAPDSVTAVSGIGDTTLSRIRSLITVSAN